MSNKLKFEKLERRVSNLERSQKQTETQLSLITERNIVDDLSRETFPGSGRPLYTYENTADRNGTSASTVSRIADKHGISRRGIRSV